VSGLALLVAGASLVWALVLRRRLRRAADVEHELRGALTAVGLAAQRSRDAGLTAAYEGQLARVRSAAGGGGERCELAGLLPALTVPAGTAVVLGNLVANAAEHGEGPLTVRIELVNRQPDRSLNGYGGYGLPSGSMKRGRGLRIAARAARTAGGRLDVRDDGGRFAAAVELPVER
jgi:signal transduction histidine kinase